MKNEKGQALIEFVLILPALIFLIFATIDFGLILYTKNHLESRTGDILSLLADGKSYDEIKNQINYQNSYPIELKLDYGSDGYLTIDMSGVVDLITPGLNLILDDPYLVKITRVVPYES